MYKSLKGKTNSYIFYILRLFVVLFHFYKASILFKTIAKKRKIGMLSSLKNKLPDLVLGFLFFAIISQRPEPYFSFVMWIFLLFLIYDVYRCHKLGKPYVPNLKEIRVIIGGMAIFYGALILDSLLIGDMGAVRKAIDYMCYTGPFFMVWWIRSKYTSDEGAAWGIATGILASCVLGIWHLHIHLRPIVDRLYGSYFHPNVFATALTTTSPMTAYFSVRSKKGAPKALLALCTVVQIIALYFTYSRGGYLSFIAGFPLAVFIVVMTARTKIASRVKKGLIGFIILALILGGGALYIRQDSLSASQKLGGERIQMRTASMEMWKEHKFLGVGLDNWQENYYGKYKPARITEFDNKQPHNMTIYFLATSGLLGFLGYYAFLCSVFYSVITIGRRGNPLLYIAVLCVLLAFYIHGWLDQTIITKGLSRIYFAVLGYYMAVMADLPEKIKNRIRSEKDESL